MHNKILAVLIISLICCSCTSKFKLTSEGQTIINSLSSMKHLEQRHLMDGTPYQTPAFIFDSGKPGSNIIILGGTHGDEPAGYEASLRLVNIFQKRPPVAGKIILVPLANRLSINTYNRRIPVPEGVDRERGNLNRCYPGKANGLPMEQMAYHIQELAYTYDIDVFIDLHEARYLHLDTPPESEREFGLGQTLIYYPNEPTSELLIYLLDGINTPISDSDDKFSALEQPILNSAAWWAGEYLDIAAFTFETTRAMPIERRIGFHLDLVRIVLEVKGIWK